MFALSTGPLKPLPKHVGEINVGKKSNTFIITDFFLKIFAAISIK